MAKNPPLDGKMRLSKGLKWEKHFEPPKLAARPQLRDTPPYPKELTIFRLCSDSYNENPNYRIIPEHWKRLWSVREHRSAYFGAIYVNEKDNQVVLAHRGTKLDPLSPIKTVKAVKADIAIGSNTISGQMFAAMTCSYELMRKRMQGWKLIIAGHSLGSYLTDVSIFSLMYLEPSKCGEVFCKRNDVRDPNVIDILPYGIGIDGPGEKDHFHRLENNKYDDYSLGSFDIILKLRDITGVRYASGEQMRVEDLPVNQFVSVPNLVNCNYRQIGRLFQIPMESSVWKDIPIIGDVVTYVDDSSGKIQTHFLGK